MQQDKICFALDNKFLHRWHIKIKPKKENCITAGLLRAKQLPGMIIILREKGHRKRPFTAPG